ncbi:MAG: hypothetical protein AAF806_22330 [Bacteroidota bacterium]
MDLLNQLDIYINAQKGVGFQAFLFGFGLLLSALLFHLLGSSALSEGIRTGSIVCGILLFGMGFGLRMSQENIRKEKSVLFQKDPIEFKQSERERMEKVKNNYPNYQLVMAIVILVLLLFYFFIKIPFWQGVAISVILFMIGNMFIEYFSQKTVLAYYEFLKELF